MKRTSYLLFCVSALALMLLQPAYSVVAYNYVSFYQSTDFHYYTYGDFVPNAPLSWDYVSSYYEFYNSWDDSGETFDAPYLNLTTVMTYDGFEPMYNQTGIGPGGIPYYIWNYTKLMVPEDDWWAIWGYSENCSTAPGFATGRLYHPKVITEENAILYVLTGARVEEEVDYLCINIYWYETSETKPTLKKAVLKSPTQEVAAQSVRTSASISWSIDDPPLGTYQVGLIFRVSNRIYPAPVKYLPEINVYTSASEYGYPGYVGSVTFAALDGSIITIAGKNSYYWYASSYCSKSVWLGQVSETA
ncbi:MAG: hypothetical protein JSV57_00285 [Candidatus Bathyarchaeota archaeon]|nr:MAG: hypothetical protein JSV57_00285 [Candidatus Bathyarchaeota archaeon]